MLPLAKGSLSSSMSSWLLSKSVSFFYIGLPLLTYFSSVNCALASIIIGTPTHLKEPDAHPGAMCSLSQHGLA